MCNLRKLGLLAMAATALIAFVGTSVAGATPATFTAAGAGKAVSTTKVTQHVFSVEGNEAVCEEVEFTGETAGSKSESQTISPEFNKCTAFGFASEVKENGCDLEDKAATDGASMSTIRLFGCNNATEGMVLEANVPFVCHCKVDVPEQSVSSSMHYTNQEPGGWMAVDVEATVTGIMNDVTTSTGLCPLKVGTNSTGQYSGVQQIYASGGVTWSAAS